MKGGKREGCVCVGGGGGGAVIDEEVPSKLNLEKQNKSINQ